MPGGRPLLCLFPLETLTTVQTDVVRRHVRSNVKKLHIYIHLLFQIFSAHRYLECKHVEFSDAEGRV